MQKRYLISGSHGFIGQAIMSRLIADGHVVMELPRELLSKPSELAELLSIHKPDHIIHAAAYGNHYHQRDFLQTIESNIVYTANLLEASQCLQYKSFINFSTSSVYLPIQTYYSATKKATEHICETYAKTNNKPIVTIRPYSVYGPGEADFRFIPKIVKAAKYGESLQLAGNYNHDWIYVEDFIDALLLVTENSDKLSGQAVDIGTGREYSNQRIFETLEKLHGHQIEHDKVDRLRDFDGERWICDNSALEYMGWKQNTSLFVGLKKTYDYY